MKFRGILLFAAGLLIGGLVIPAAAQTDPAENQLVIRSDGFIFLLRGAQRHLVSPVALSDKRSMATRRASPSCLAWYR